jgi:hypothetical protein
MPAVPAAWWRGRGRPGERPEAEQDDEWAVADRRYFSAESMKPLTQPLVTASQEELVTAIA